MTVRVFVSSTWLDLRPERKAAETAIHRLRETKFIGMEYFGSRDETTQETSLDEVDRSDVYVGIFGGRYGSGVTEDEYRRAIERKLPCFAYFKDETLIPLEWKETDPAKIERLAALKEDLKIHTVSTFISPDDLAINVTADLHRWLFDSFLPLHLEEALRWRSRSDARALLNEIKSIDELPAGLVKRLKEAKYVTASGERHIAVDTANNSNMISGDHNVTEIGSHAGHNVGRDQIINNHYDYPTGQIQSVVPHQLPPPPSDFTGRTNELKKLKSAITRRKKKGGVHISGLQGLCGVGKTALALKLADDIKSQYPDGQFYLNLKGDGPLALPVTQALLHVIRVYRPEAKLRDGGTELSGLYRSLLDGKRTLLLIDNVRDAAQVSALVPPESCLMIVTSRQHFTLPGLIATDLNKLPSQDAKKLLLAIAPRVGDQADAIAKLCGYLPLALRLAASTLQVRTNLSPVEYLRRLSNAEERIKLLDQASQYITDNVGVKASISASYELLSPETALRWAALSVFTGTFDDNAAAAVWQVGQNTATDTLGKLIGFSLIEWDETTSRYRLHDLVSLVANTYLCTAARTAGRKRHAFYYKDVLGRANKLYLHGGEAMLLGLALFDLEVDNINAGHTWAASNAENNNEAAKLCYSYTNVGSHVLGLRQHPREQIKWLEIALRETRRLRLRSSEGYVLANLAASYSELGEIHKAIEFYELRLSIARDSNDRRCEGSCFGGLGNVYYASREVRRGIEFHEQCLAIAREIGERRGEGQALGNLGNGYYSLGETRAAIEFYNQQLAITCELGDKQGEGNALGNLGCAYRVLRDTGRAMELFEQSLDIKREIGDRRGEGNTLWNMSLMLADLGSWKQAITFAEAAFNIYEQIENPNATVVSRALAEWQFEQCIRRSGPCDQINNRLMQ